MDPSFFLFYLSSLFALIDPIGGTPIFVAYTDRFEQADVGRIARVFSLTARRPTESSEANRT